MKRSVGQRQVHLLLQLLGMTIALSAIVALPLCLADGYAPLLDNDVRTITEHRSITEIVTTPGVHVLHADHGVGEACETCLRAQSQPVSPDHIHFDDLGQRVALLPDVIAVDVAPVAENLTSPHALAVAATTSPDSPPPR